MSQLSRVATLLERGRLVGWCADLVLHLEPPWVASPIRFGPITA